MARHVSVNPSDRGCVLVVDDDRHVRAVVSIRLRGSGYDVVEVEDGPAALKRVQKGGIDVIVLDAMMPGMDGFEVLGRLNLLENRPSVIFLTAMDENDSRIKALYGGPVDFIGKPFDTVKFLTLVAEALRKRQLIQGAREEPPAGRIHRKKAATNSSSTDTSVLQRLIPGMLKDMNAAYNSMEAAQKKEDLKSIESLGHSIKGTSGVFGFRALSDMGRAIEVSAQARDHVETRKLIGKLALLLEKIDKNGSEPDKSR